MIHKIVSFYKKGLNPDIINYQKKVFDKFEVPLLQKEFETHHHDAIEAFLKNEQWDSVSIIDIDLIPLRKDVFKIAEKIISENPVIYGNAQASNSSAYVAPSFLNFTRFIYTKVGYTSFCGGFYEDKEIDVGEGFSITAKQKNIDIQFSFPTKSLIPLWKCDHGIHHFEFGIGTYYDNNTFHCFQVRQPDRQQIFIDECKKLLS